VIELLAAEGIDPGPIAAWLGLASIAVAMFAGVIAFLWWWVAMPQIREAIDVRVDQVEQVNSASVRRLHERIDKHIAEQHIAEQH
jgi:hypothetical protein